VRWYCVGPFSWRLLGRHAAACSSTSILLPVFPIPHSPALSPATSSVASESPHAARWRDLSHESNSTTFPSGHQAESRRASKSVQCIILVLYSHGHILSPPLSRSSTCWRAQVLHYRAVPQVNIIEAYHLGPSEKPAGNEQGSRRFLRSELEALQFGEGRSEGRGQPRGEQSHYGKVDFAYAVGVLRQRGEDFRLVLRGQAQAMRGFAVSDADGQLLRPQIQRLPRRDFVHVDEAQVETTGRFKYEGSPSLTHSKVSIQGTCRP